MRALVLNNAGISLRTDYPQPVSSEANALLKIRKAGICNTDLELVKGYLSFSGVLGHEFVTEVTEGRPEWLGKRVVGEINVADGDCDMCRRGIPSQCRNRSTIGIRGLDGAFADYMILPYVNLYEVPDEVTDDMAVFTEPVAAALQIHEAVHLQPRDRVVVIGIGKLGMLCAQAARLTGAEVLGVVRREKQAKLLEGWGIIPVALEDLAHERAQVVIECTGNEQGFASALDLVEPRGTIILKSTYAGIPAANLSKIAVNELRVIGSRCGPFASALRLLQRGDIDILPMIEGRYAFDDVLPAFDQASERGALKVLLEM